jgi:hypothetical protein
MTAVVGSEKSQVVAKLPAAMPLDEAASRGRVGAPDIRPADAAFREGDEVVLAKGTYQGTAGVFLRLRADANWADIGESNGGVRSHPVAWLAHFAGALPGSAS